MRHAFAVRPRKAATKDGGPKTGKSTLATAVAVGEASGQDAVTGQKRTVGRVVWLLLEEAAADFVQRCVRFAGNKEVLIHSGAADRIHVVERMPGGMQNIHALRRIIGTVEPTLVVLDTVAAMWGAAVSDENDASQVGRYLLPLTQLSHDSGVCLFSLLHAKKDGGFRGSSAIVASVDSLTEMTVSTGDRMVRDFSVWARWTVPDFALRLGPSGYSLAGAESLSLDARILVHVADTPGQSLNAVAKAVKPARTKNVRDAVWALIARNALENRGTADHMELFIPNRTR